ncbi:MAG: hypothetical protein ACRC4M_00780 [Mycoplasma sp.]
MIIKKGNIELINRFQNGIKEDIKEYLKNKSEFEYDDFRNDIDIIFDKNGISIHEENEKWNAKNKYNQWVWGNEFTKEKDSLKLWYGIRFLCKKDNNKIKKVIESFLNGSDRDLLKFLEKEFKVKIENNREYSEWYYLFIKDRYKIERMLNGILTYLY